MERLTYWCDDGMGGGEYRVNENGTEYSGHSIDRLAAYEDTGLEPEEVQNIVTFENEKICPEKELTLFGKPISYWREVNKVEQEGRPLVLPCRVGDIVWTFWDVPTSPRYDIYCAEVKEITIGKKHIESDISVLLEPVDFRGGRKEYGKDDFGKTVFRTREEAEAKLKEREGK